MIQFNLLPDVKLQFVKAQRTKRLVTLISIVVSAVSIVALLLMVVTVDVVQKKSLHDLNNDVAKYSSQLKGIADLDKILTVQNQLNTLTGLHDQKVVSSRLFSYIAQLTPNKASISNLNIDFAASTMIVTGQATGLDIVNTYADTLKATTYQVNGAGSTRAFKNVVLTSFSRTVKGASYTISFGFDPIIFNSQDAVQLTVPAGSTADPSNLFHKQGA